jgi:hypothetical protein
MPFGQSKISNLKSTKPVFFITTELENVVRLQIAMAPVFSERRASRLGVVIAVIDAMVAVIVTVRRRANIDGGYAASVSFRAIITSEGQDIAPVADH